MLEAGTNGAAAVAIARQRIAKCFREVKSSHDFIRACNEVMAGLAEGVIDPKTAQEMCRTANVILRTLDLQLKHGHLTDNGDEAVALTEGEKVDLVLPPRKR